MTAESPKSPSHFPLYEDYVGNSFNQDPNHTRGRPRELGAIAANVGIGDDEEAKAIFPLYGDRDGGVDYVKAGNKLVRSGSPLELPELSLLKQLIDIEFDKAVSVADGLFYGHSRIKPPSYREMAKFFNLEELNDYYAQESESGNNPFVFLYSPNLGVSSYDDIAKRIWRRRGPHTVKDVVGAGGGRIWTGGYDSYFEKLYLDQEEGRRWGLGVLNRKPEGTGHPLETRHLPRVSEYLAAQLSLYCQGQLLVGDGECVALNYNAQKLPLRHDTMVGHWSSENHKIKIFSGRTGLSDSGDTPRNVSRRIRKAGGVSYYKFRGARPLSTFVS